MAQKFVADCKVLNNEKLNQLNFHLILEVKGDFPAFRPGQFVNIEVPGVNDVFLRRPFSVYQVDYVKKTISLLVKILGKGSERLSRIQPGDRLSMVYPLGNGFTIPAPDDKILLVGGGSGVAPMLFLASECKLKKENADLLIGARTDDDLIDIQSYTDYANLHFTTEDGSLGTRGYVTNHEIFEKSLAGYTKIYACGPLAMMKAVAAKAKEKNIFCEVSLENLMACGFGVCLCCIEPTLHGNVCVCTEGPVFNIEKLKWQI